MNNRQIARLEAGKRVQVFNTTHATQLATIEDFAQEQTDLNTVVDKLDKAQQVQAADTTGHADTKLQLRTAMAELLVIYTERGLVKARRAGNNALAAQLDHGERYYINGDATTALNRAKATVTAIKANAALLTNIAAADIAKMDAAIAAFEATMLTPTVVSQHKKTHGTDIIDPLLDEMDVYIEHIMGLVHSYFSKTAMAAELDLTAKLQITGSRHNVVTFHIEDAATATAIANVTVTLDKTGKIESSDAAGIALFEKASTGNQNFTITATGYTTQTATAKVLRSTNTDVVVKLKKV